MAIPFLATKLFIPSIHRNLVPRLRLVHQLEKGKSRKLTLISAPAGSGKTTIFCQWHFESGATLPVSWLSLEPADNDLPRFLQYFIASLDTLQSGLAAEIQPLLESTGQPDWETILSLIINRLSVLEQDSILAMDDYHLVDNPIIHSILIFLLDHLPPRLHLVLLTRADPPLPLSRLRASGQLVEIRAADLRFNLEESTQFLNDLMGLKLSIDQVAALEKRTEGWIAGLQLAALSMQDREDVQGFVDSFTRNNQYIIDYLADEVLSRQPETLHQFLLKTSVVERFCGSLCNALTGENEGETTLKELDRLNLFLISLDDEHHWYRYHHLFADLLRRRLEFYQQGLEADLHLRASAWFEAQNLFPEAVSHALKSGEIERTARLVEQNMMVMIERGHLATLLEWLNTLPVELVTKRPWLCIARAWVLAYTGAYDDATECLVDAAQALEGDPGHPLSREETDHIRGHIYAIRCYMLGVSNRETDQLMDLSLKALELLPASDGRARGLVSVMLSVGYRQKMNFTAAGESLERALEIARAADQKYVIIDLLCQSAMVSRDQGYYHRAEATCREVLHLVDEFGSAPPVTSYALCLLSDFSYEWNDMVAARLYARKALDLGRQWGSTDIIHSALHSSAMPLIFARDFDRVLEIIEEMKLLYIPTGRYPRFPVVVESLARLHMRDFSGAVHCVNDVLSHTDSEWCMERLMPVYIALFRQGFRSSLDDVLDFITSFLPLCEAVDCPSGRVHALICRAMALEALGRGVEAGDFLKQALTIAEPEGYIRSIIDFGVPMQTLLVSVQEADRKLPDKTSQRRIEYTGRLLAILGEEISTGKPAVPSSPDLVEQLSSRELEVLKLLAQGCSDKQIAATLVIARETVHKHLKNIYGKLGVHNRTEAASRAHQLGLL